MRFWAVDDGSATGFPITAAGTPADEGLSEGLRCHELSRRREPYENFDWDTLALVSPDLAEVDTHLTGLVDARRAELSRPYLITDPAKQLEYQRKAEEARRDKGPWPWMEELAYRRGTDVETERLLILDAIERDDAMPSAISSTALKAKSDILAAPTAAAKRAIFAAIPWPTEGEDNG